MNEYSLLIDDSGSNRNINSLYLFNLYYYYYNGGYSNLILSQTMNLMVLLFTVVFMTFLIQCVQFSEMIKYDQNKPISFWKFVNWDQYWNMGIFMWVCTSIVISYSIIQAYSILNSLKKFKKIRKIYRNDLKIESKDLGSMTWNDIASKICLFHSDPNLNFYTIALQIMIKENLMISFFDKIEEFDFNKVPITKLLEWNFIFCFLDPLINNQREIKSDFDRQKYIEKVQKRLNAVAILNLIFLPFIFIFMLLYMFLQYGEQFYNNPELIMHRQWTIKSFWKLRYYNELPHLYRKRLSKAGKLTTEYLDGFPWVLMETLSRLVLYILGSFFMLFLILSVINENLFMNLHITSKQPVLWYMGIIGAILGIGRKFVKSTIKPMSNLMDKIGQEITLKDEWMNDHRSIDTAKEIKEIFQLRIFLLFKECLYLILTPLILRFNLYRQSDKICSFLVNQLTDYHAINPDTVVAKHSLFRNEAQINRNPKTLNSYNRFKLDYPEWGTGGYLYNLGESQYQPSVYGVNNTQSLIDDTNESLLGDISTSYIP